MSGSCHAAASQRYFGRQRGITWYHWMIDQQMDIHGIAVTGALKDAPYLLDGLLEQETHHRPTELITDTGGYSDIVFGFFRLLGYWFSPRLADLGDARFWRMNRKTDYGILNGLAPGPHALGHAPSPLKVGQGILHGIGGRSKLRYAAIHTTEQNMVTKRERSTTTLT